MSRKTGKKKKSLSSIFLTLLCQCTLWHIVTQAVFTFSFYCTKEFFLQMVRKYKQTGFKRHSKLARWLSFQGIKVTTAVWKHERGANSEAVLRHDAAKRNQPDSRRDSSNHDWTNVHVQVQQNLISNLLHAKNWSLHYPEYNSTAYSSGIWLCFCAFVFGSVGWKGKFAKMPGTTSRKAGEHFCL